MKMRCKKCKTEKEVNEQHFRKSRRNLYGYDLTCRECRKLEERKKPSVKDAWLNMYIGRTF